METLLESRLWKYAMTGGALSAVLGGLILAWPGTTILVASTLFGVYLLMSGFAGVAMAFTLPESAGMRVMLFISGVLSVILAVLCLRNFGNPYPVLLLSIWIGVSFMSKASRSWPSRSATRRCPLGVGTVFSASCR